MEKRPGESAHTAFPFSPSDMNDVELVNVIFLDRVRVAIAAVELKSSVDKPSDPMSVAIPSFQTSWEYL
jgi:hypothetical protein